MILHFSIFHKPTIAFVALKHITNPILSIFSRIKSINQISVHVLAANALTPKLMHGLLSSNKPEIGTVRRARDDEWRAKSAPSFFRRARPVPLYSHSSFFFHFTSERISHDNPVHKAVFKSLRNLSSLASSVYIPLIAKTDSAKYFIQYFQMQYCLKYRSVVNVE